MSFASFLLFANQSSCILTEKSFLGRDATGISLEHKDYFPKQNNMLWLCLQWWRFSGKTENSQKNNINNNNKKKKKTMPENGWFVSLNLRVNIPDENNNNKKTESFTNVLQAFLHLLMSDNYMTIPKNYYSTFCFFFLPFRKSIYIYHLKHVPL